MSSVRGARVILIQTALFLFRQVFTNSNYQVVHLHEKSVKSINSNNSIHLKQPSGEWIIELDGMIDQDKWY